MELDVKYYVHVQNFYHHPQSCMVDLQKQIKQAKGRGHKLKKYDEIIAKLK
jgi:hypothetical protein